MIQKISVRAIIQLDGKTLMLRRANGRQTILGKYEIPGGKLAYGEQPEDALRRYVHDDAGLHIRTAQLFDAVAYIDRDDRNIQYVVIVYMVNLVPEHRPIKLSGNYDKYSWKAVSKTQRSDETDITDLTLLLLGIIQQDEITETALHSKSPNVDKNATKETFTVYSDGGSRGNPGPSAAGYVIINSSNEVVAQGGEFLGFTNSAMAEYHGVRIAMERAKEMGIRHIAFRIDSMMVVNQMKGYYRIKNRELWPIHEHIRHLMKSFDHVTFSHVLREFNQLADGMVNKTLDEQENGSV